MFRLSHVRNHSKVLTLPLNSFSKRFVETAGLYQSRQEELIFTKPISNLHPSHNVVPSFNNKVLVMKNAQPTTQTLHSWEDALTNDIVRSNFTERWGLKQLSSIQKAVLSTMKERVVSSTHKVLEPFSHVDDKSLHVKLMLDPKNSSLKKVLQLREAQGETPALGSLSQDIESSLKVISEDVASSKDFYIQASDHSGKLTSVLSVVADDLLTQNPNLAPFVNTPPSIDVYKIFQEREKCHPNVIIITQNEEESLHAYRLAQRAFARSNASVQWVKYDIHGEDFFNKAFNLGANVLVTDHYTFHKVVNRGWISSLDLKYLVIDDAHKISNEPNIIEGIFEPLFVQSSWLGQSTKRIVLSANDAYHTTRFSKTVLRQGFISLVVDEVEIEKPFFHSLDLANPRTALSATPSNSIIIVEDDESAQELLSLFQKANLLDVAIANDVNANERAQDLSLGRYNNLIVSFDAADSIITAFPNPIHIAFYNTLNSEILSRLNRLNSLPQKVHVILGENVKPIGLNHIVRYCDLFGIDLESRFQNILLSVNTSFNLTKNFKAKNFIEARSMISQIRNPGPEIDDSDVQELIYTTFEKVAYTNAIENERALRLEKLHSQISQDVNNLFRKTPEFRDFYKLQFLNSIDKEQYKYLKKVIFSKPRYTVGDLLEALDSFGVEWQSPAVSLHNNLIKLNLAIQRSEPRLSLSALKQFNRLRGAEEPNSAILKFHDSLSVYYDMITEKRIENFFNILDSAPVTNSLSKLPNSELEFAKWYSQLDENVGSALEALADVLVAIENGVLIPSAYPIEVDETAIIRKELNELTSSQEFLDEWISANLRAITEIEEIVPVKEASTFEEKEKNAVKLQIETIIEKHLLRSPVLARERELEVDLVKSQYYEHYVFNPLIQQ